MGLKNHVMQAEAVHDKQRDLLVNQKQVEFEPDYTRNVCYDKFYETHTFDSFELSATGTLGRNIAVPETIALQGPTLTLHVIYKVRNNV